jgi:starch synthase
MKILFVASECVPFCKTGGLADVVSALPKELKNKRHDVRIILPKYKSIRSQEFNIRETGEWVQVPMGPGHTESADIRLTRTEKGIPVYFIHHEPYFGRPGLYRGPQGDYPDNAERFAFFSRAVLETCKAIQFRPDIIHCHDWQTGLIPMMLKVLFQQDSFFQNTRTVFTIHNIAYQGIFPKSKLPVTGFSWNEFTIDKFEFYDQICYLKAGLVFSDLLNTVSPTYAQEIQSSYSFGWGMEGLLRSRAKDLAGIVNGIDQDDWNPAKDPFLAHAYDPEHLEGRQACKAALQDRLKFSVSPDVPLLGIVARLDKQKGLDLLTQIIPDLLNQQNAQIVVLGQGDEAIMQELKAHERSYPGHVRVISDFNEPLAHNIYGGSDIFLMPSRFEPCGLGQMIAMRYGSIPVVANTGGLHDTVTAATREEGNGFLFQPGWAPGFLQSILSAIQFYRDSSAWKELMRRAMKTDFSWARSVPTYHAFYRRAHGLRPVQKSTEKSPRRS